MAPINYFSNLDEMAIWPSYPFIGQPVYECFKCWIHDWRSRLVSFTAKLLNELLIILGGESVSVTDYFRDICTFYVTNWCLNVWNRFLVWTRNGWIDCSVGSIDIPIYTSIRLFLSLLTDGNFLINRREIEQNFIIIYSRGLNLTLMHVISPETNCMVYITRGLLLI